MTYPNNTGLDTTQLPVDADPTLAADSDILIPTQKAVKTYVDTSALGEVKYQGTWNANTNTPTITSGVGTQGFYYKVSVAGTTTVDGISEWNVGDMIIFNGTTWDKIDNTEEDATASIKGVIQLAGDLGGSAASPSVVKVNGNTPGVSAVAHKFVTAIDSSARGTLAQPDYSDLTGTPTIPSIDTITPQMDGTGAAGTNGKASDSGHVHPTDTSRQATLTFPLDSTLGGTGINNAGKLTLASDVTISGGGAIVLGGYTLTIPATGTAALLATANVFTAAQKINVNSTTALLVEQTGVKNNVFVVDTTNAYVTASGFKFGTDTSDSTYTDLWTTGVTPSGTNYFMSVKTADSSAVWFNALSGGFFAFAYANTALLNIKNNKMAFGQGTTENFLTYPSFLIAAASDRDALAISNTSVSGNKAWEFYPYTNSANTDLRIYEYATSGSGIRYVFQSGGNLGIGNTSPSARIHATLSDSGTNAVTAVGILGHNSSGTPAAGFGASQLFTLKSSTTNDRNAAEIDAVTVVSTDASRTYRLVFLAYDYGGAREGMRIEASGSAPMIGFYGKAAVVQATTAGAAATFAANTSGIANDTATWGGYTIGQLMQAAINVGLLQ